MGPAGERHGRCLRRGRNRSRYHGPWAGGRGPRSAVLSASSLIAVVVIVVVPVLALALVIVIVVVVVIVMSLSLSEPGPRAGRWRTLRTRWC